MSVNLSDIAILKNDGVDYCFIITRICNKTNEKHRFERKKLWNFIKHKDLLSTI